MLRLFPSSTWDPPRLMPTGFPFVQLSLSLSRLFFILFLEFWLKSYLFSFLLSFVLEPDRVDHNKSGARGRIRSMTITHPSDTLIHSTVLFSLVFLAFSLWIFSYRKIGIPFRCLLIYLSASIPAPLFSMKTTPSIFFPWVDAYLRIHRISILHHHSDDDLTPEASAYTLHWLDSFPLEKKNITKEKRNRFVEGLMIICFPLVSHLFRFSTTILDIFIDNINGYSFFYLARVGL